MHPPDLPAGSPTRSDSPRGESERGESRAPRRVLTQMGVEWTVTECDGANVPGARGPRCLVFASAEAIRRVWDVPPDWHTLPDAALFALSWRR